MATHPLVTPGFSAPTASFTTLAQSSPYIPRTINPQFANLKEEKGSPEYPKISIPTF